MALKEKGISAEYLSSTQTTQTKNKVNFPQQLSPCPYNVCFGGIPHYSSKLLFVFFKTHSYNACIPVCLVGFITLYKETTKLVELNMHEGGLSYF